MRHTLPLLAVAALPCAGQPTPTDARLAEAVRAEVGTPASDLPPPAGQPVEPRNIVAALRALGPLDRIAAVLRADVARLRLAQPRTRGELFQLVSSLYALGQLRDRDAVPLLTNLLLDERVDHVARGQVAEALAAIDLEQARHVLLTALERRPTSFTLRRQLVDSLSGSSDLLTQQALEHFRREEQSKMVQRHLDAALVKMRARDEAAQQP